MMLANQGTDNGPLTAGYLRAIQIIHLAAVTGATLLGVVALVLYFSQAPADARPDLLIDKLAAVNWFLIALAFFGFWMAELIFKRQIAKRMPQNTGPDEALPWRLQNVRSALITKVMIHEMMASLGWMAFLLTVFQGLIYSNSLYWFDTAPYILFIYLTLNNWPSAERVRALLQAGLTSIR